MKKIFKDIEDNFCAAILLAMLILTFVNVVARKLLNSSMPFVEELTTCGLMMLSIIGAATAAKRGAHLGLSLFTDMMPLKAQRYVALVGDILAAAFSGLIVYYGYFMVLNEVRQQAENRRHVLARVAVWNLASHRRRGSGYPLYSACHKEFQECKGG